MHQMILYKMEHDPRPCVYREYADIAAAPEDTDAFVQELMALLHRFRARNGLPAVEPYGLHYDAEGEEWVCLVRGVGKRV